MSKEIQKINFILKNKYPEIIENEFPELPKENSKVDVLYSNGSTNSNVYFSNGKFVNNLGSELFGIIGWRPYVQKNETISFYKFFENKKEVPDLTDVWNEATFMENRGEISIYEMNEIWGYLRKLEKYGLIKLKNEYGE